MEGENFIAESRETELASLLRERGREDPEAKAQFMAWLFEQEKQAEASPDATASVMLNLNRARLYRSAGFIEEARENFEDAARYAEGLGEDELAKQLLKEAAQLDS